MNIQFEKLKTLTFNNYIYMYTVYQFIFVIIILLFPKLFPEWFIDIVRSSCILIACLWSCLYFYFGYDEIMRIYAELIPFIPDNLCKYIYPLIDFIGHYSVVFLIGLPKNASSIIYSSAIIYIWFEINKQRLNTIYHLPIIKKI